LNIGLRYDGPSLSANGVSGTIASFSSFAPRVGFTYDFSGDASFVAHGHYGRYFDKMRTDAFVTSIPGLESIAYYMGVMPGPLTSMTADQVAALKQVKLFEIDLSKRYSVASGLRAPHTDVLSLGLEKRLFADFALSIDYIYKTDRDMLYIGDKTNHTFEAVEWTDNYVNFGKTHTLYQLTDSLPNDWVVANSQWAKRNHHIVIVSLRKTDFGKWSFMTSFTYQNSQGNVDNMSGDYNSTLFGLDQDPNYTKNPDRWGYLSFARPFQFKLITGYVFPWDISVTADFRWLAGRYWNANGYWGEPPVTGLWPSGIFPLEARGSRQTPGETCLNLRLAKSFNLGSSKKLDLYLDVFNVFNNSDFLSESMENVHTQPNATWKITPGVTGDAFGQPFQLVAPLTARFGLRFSF
jgi:hypothetical protein